MTSCPRPDELVLLLTDEVVGPRHDTLIDHVGDCPVCQQRLEAMSVDSAEWSDYESLLRTDRVAWPTFAHQSTRRRSGSAATAVGDPDRLNRNAQPTLADSSDEQPAGRPPRDGAEENAKQVASRRGDVEQGDAEQGAAEQGEAEQGEAEQGEAELGAAQPGSACSESARSDGAGSDRGRQSDAARIATDRVALTRPSAPTRADEATSAGEDDEPLVGDAATTAVGGGRAIVESLRSRNRLPTLPGYEIIKLLGAGGMGVVYLARHHRLNRLVALKTIRSGREHDPGYRQRFQDEAEMLARLKHPNLVQIYDVLEHDDCPCLALEYVDGDGLDRILRRHRLPPREAAVLVETVARAVQAAHEQGIVHRDIKPANILLQGVRADATGASVEIQASHRQRVSFWESLRSDSVDGVASGPQADVPIVKVTDFGIADQLDASSSTRTGDLMGTPSYMAPEQAEMRPGWSTPAVDTYALGVILYELLTGKPPFVDASPFNTVQKVISETPERPSKRRAGVPRDLEAICLKCLEKNASRRYDSSRELAEDLRRFVEGKPIQARRQGWWVHAQKWVARRPIAATLVGVAILSLIASAVAWSVARNEWNRRIRATEVGKLQTRRAKIEAIQDMSVVHERLSDDVERIRYEPDLQSPARRADRNALIAQTTSGYKNLLRRIRNLSTIAPEAPFQTRRDEVYAHLAFLQYESGEQSAALSSMGKALSERRQWLKSQEATEDSDWMLVTYQIEYAQYLRRAGKFEEARSTLDEAISTLDADNFSPSPPAARRWYVLAHTLGYYAARLANQSGGVAKANGYLDRAVVAIDASIGDESLQELPSHETANCYGLASMYHRELARRHFAKEQLNQSERHGGAAVAHAKRAVEVDAGNARHTEQLASAHAVQGRIHGALNRPQQSRQCFQAAIQVRRELTPDATRRGKHLYELGTLHRAVAELDLATKNLPEARANYLEAIGCLRDAADVEPENRNYAMALGDVLRAYPRKPAGTPDALFDARLKAGVEILQRFHRPGRRASEVLSDLQDIQEERAEMTLGTAGP